MPKPPNRSPEDFAEEIRAHLALEADDLKAEGLTESEAHRRANAAFGSRAAAKERFLLRNRIHWLDSLRLDAKFALRQLLRSPGFTLTVILTLALAIGANTAIFSLVNALLLKDLPYPRPEQLATLYARYTGTPEATPEGGRKNIDGEGWDLLRDNAPSFISAISSGLASGVNLQARTSSGLQDQYLHSGRVSAHYFDVLGIRPILGRNFTEAEDRPHAPKTAILSYSLWQTTFRADPAIIGQPIVVKGEVHTVIGILPDSSTTPLNADLYTAIQGSRDGEGGGTNYDVILRLRASQVSEAAWQQANSEITHAFAVQIARFASRNPGATVTYFAVPLQKASTTTIRPQVLVLMLAAAAILLIACANLAGLTLVRMTRRSAEFATRLALGASQWQIQRQLWIENLLLALIGGLVGIGTGYLALRGLLTLLLEHFLPVPQVPLDSRVLAFTLLATLATSILFGMLPALTTRRIDIRSAIANRGIASHSSLRLRQTLIAGEVALTVLLLAASGLLIRTLIHLQALPAGFNPNGVLTAKLSLDDVRYHDPAAFQKLLNSSLTAMRQIPGVQSATVGLTLPYEHTLNDNITLSGPTHAGQQILTNLVYITPGYLQTLQIPLLRGRDFTDADSSSTEMVAIVNQTFARKFLSAQDPLGSYLNPNTKYATRIIGIAADVAVTPSLDPTEPPITTDESIYIPAAQMQTGGLTVIHTWFQPNWLIRTGNHNGHPDATLTAQMQRALASADPNLPFSGFYTMNDLLARALATQRIEVALLATMAALALLLSTLGIFALVANLVAQRTREIGIRIALGSTIRQAMIHVGGTGIVASAIGLILGMAISAAALRTLRSVLYGVQVYDPATLLAVVLTLAVVTLLATTLPTLRIARIDPAKTLREN